MPKRKSAPTPPIEHAPVSGGLALLETAQSLTITSDAQADCAGRIMRDAKAMLDTIEAHYKPILAAIEASKRAVRDMRDEDARPWQQAADLSTRMLGSWRAAEKQRIDAEQAIAAAALEDLMAADPDGAPARLSEALAAVPVAAPKLDGLTEVTRWHGTVTHLGAFVAAVAAGRIPLEAVTPNQAWLDSEARRLHESMSAVYPGTTATSTVTFSRR